MQRNADGSSGSNADRYNTRAAADQQNQQQQANSQGRMYTGGWNLHDTFKNLMGSDISKDDELGRSMRLTTGWGMLQKKFDYDLSKGQAEHSAGLSMQMGNYFSKLATQEQANARNHEFSLGMASMDKQYELQNQFANQQFSRDIAGMAATGEQQRKTIAAEGVQNRLQAVTEGEQDRLGYAAQGDQNRKTMSHADRIEAGKEKRHRDYAVQQSRNF